jgi:hypothetical protein
MRVETGDLRGASFFVDMGLEPIVQLPHAASKRIHHGYRWHRPYAPVFMIIETSDVSDEKLSRLPTFFDVQGTGFKECVARDPCVRAGCGSHRRIRCYVLDALPKSAGVGLRLVSDLL